MQHENAYGNRPLPARTRYGLGSSHYSWSAGMDASFIDPLLVKPHTSWHGTRGVRIAFGDHGFDADDDYGLDDDDYDLDEDDDEDDDSAFGAFWHKKEKRLELKRARFSKKLLAMKDTDQEDSKKWDRIMKKYLKAGGEEEDIADDGDDEEVSIRQSRAKKASLDSEADALFSELNEELDEDIFGFDGDDYGRLYMGAEYHELDYASPGDLGALVGRSGSSGYRGGRPTFGADATMSFGPIEYRGNEWGAFFLGAGALVLLGRGVGAW